MLEPANKLLVIDDQPDLCEFISEAAMGLGFEARAVTEPDAFRRAVQEFQPTVVVLDLQMPGADGIELLRYLGERGSKAFVLVASGMDQRVLATAQQIGRAQGLSMLAALQKPILLTELETTLRQCLRTDTPITPTALATALDRNEIGPLPAEGDATRARTLDCRRRRGARALAASRARRHLAGTLHPAGREERTDSPAHRARARCRARAMPHLGRGRSAAFSGHQPVAAVTERPRLP